MALYIDCKKCSADIPREQLSLMTQALGFYLGLAIGITEITAKNKEEVWQRIATLQHIGAPMVNDLWVTEADVIAHVGLSTNGMVRTKTQWNAFVSEIATERAMAKRARPCALCVTRNKGGGDTSYRVFYDEEEMNSVLRRDILKDVGEEGHKMDTATLIKHWNNLGVYCDYTCFPSVKVEKS